MANGFTLTKQERLSVKSNLNCDSFDFYDEHDV
jgi:hypothetical protein